MGEGGEFKSAQIQTVKKEMKGYGWLGGGVGGYIREERGQKGKIRWW